MTYFLDIVLLLFVALFILNKLRSILGSQPHEVELKKANKDAQKILKKIIKEVPQENFNQNLSPIEKSLLDIPNFNKESFINATKRVFEIILQSYADNKPEAIKPLVNKTLFDKLSQAIKNKQDNKQTTFAELISFKDAQITDVKILKTIAKIQVAFKTEQMNITKDENNNTINGDDQFIQTIQDIWTFEKSLSSSNPVWLLSSTKK